ncbi:undecaprenyl-phosphate glucose phosphotransferase [Rufibacter sp. XAAS-G3-1]|uniref:undecaprenyl-phosphate glucose phosphotransferase n=1 Tax=Rufibacter sp. XAAS-G3-1 TaxID=2729134 RepID=UPI0015E7637A|nr:undecaprenyl-phosphate glucose phosphotransferase [Rufibacter sp. XAAS-G3-1]
MSYKYGTFFKWISLSIDYILLNACLFAGLLISNPLHLETGLPDQFKLNFLLCNLLWFYCANLMGLYENVISREAIPTLKAAGIASVLYLLGTFILKAALPHLTFSFDFIWISSFLFVSVILVTKFSFLVFRKMKRHLLIDYKKIVIIGSGEAGRQLRAHIDRTPHLGYKVEGFFDDAVHGTDTLGTIDDCFAYAQTNAISEIFCALPDSQIEKVKILMHESDKHMIRFRLVPDVKYFFDKNVLVDIYGHIPIITQRQEPLENRANRLVKRAFDIAVSLFVMVFILSWLIPLMTLIIKLESRGPVFFRQIRSGTYNRPFYCYKFRSMTVNHDSDQKQAFKGDARITRVGAFIRKTSIDELPQFVNVFLGDMSVIGPRPHMVKHTQDYSALIDEYMVRHYLTPGISGWAQVNGFRGETKDTESMKQRVTADIWYLENWSLLLDIKIVFLTVWKAIRGDQNAF